MLEQELLKIIQELLEATDDPGIQPCQVEATPSDCASFIFTDAMGDKFLVTVVKIEEA